MNTNAMFRLINLICRYLYKYYCMVLFIFLLVMFTMNIGGVFFRCISYENQKDYDKISNIQKYELCQFLKFSNFHGNNNNNDLIYLDFFKKRLYLNQLAKDIVIYRCFVHSSNNTLIKIFKKHDNNIVNIDDITTLLKRYPILQNINVGQELFWLIIAQKQIKCLIWCVSSQEIRIYSCKYASFTEGIIKILKNCSNNKLFRTILLIGELNGTFIDSVRTLGLEESCIADIIHEFQYQLDFRKLRQGDRFSILVSSKIDDNNLYNKIISVRLNTLGNNYYIFRANNGKFYNQQAIRLGKNFISFPILKPYRVSSKFNLHRLNPVTGQISPHSGVDFAVPIGTPVFSIGDGEVIISKYSRVAGNYVVIKHNSQFITRYMHLNKILVKIGQKVKKGDYIALSGNTGRSTGPHLHFEVWVNNRPVNPLTVNMVNSEKLLGNERVQYLNWVHDIIPKLSFD